MALIEDKFNAAVNVIRSLPKDGPYQPSHDMMLKFYGLYKQATLGPCDEPKPSFYALVKGYKWRAWSSLGNMTKSEAMTTYVEELKKIVETMAYSDNVAAFMEALGPFYEYVELPVKNSDNNHNITLKAHDRGSPHNFEVISLCNGKGTPPNMSENGGQNSSSDELDTNAESGAKLKIPPSDNKLMANGFLQGDDGKPTAETGENSSNLDDNVVNGHHDPLQSFIKPCHDVIDENKVERRQNVLKSGSFRKFMSDTESDEEYSEPAETPELLQQKKKPNTGGRASVTGSDPINMDSACEDRGSPVLEITTCGGGDAADAGRIRLSHSYQLHQNEGTRERWSRNEESMGQVPPGGVPSRGAGAGGGRRPRRDSDDPRGSDYGAPSVNVNAQLVLILQKIHRDLEAVLIRLESLESQALSQHQQVCGLCQRRFGTSVSHAERTSWWPFPELSPRSTFFLLTWPLILQGALKLLIFLRSRRKKNVMK